MLRRSLRPVRALAYLVTSCLVAMVALAGLVLVSAAGLLVAAPFAGLPFAALPLAALERRRLALLGRPVPPSPHREPARPGLAAWVKLRYSEGATWRALGYAALLATVLGLVNAAVLTAVVASGYATFVRPFTGSGAGAQSIGFAVLFVLSVALATVIAAGHATLARTLLGGDGERDAQLLAASRARLVDAFEVERHRLERDLHDGAQQRLVALTMTLGLAALELRDGPPAARQLVDQAGEQARAALAELRELVRGIHPRVLTDHGLPAAVAELADRSPVPVTTAIDLSPRPPSTLESTAYFVIAEALANAAKHAQATAITITGQRVGGDIAQVEVRDDGIGGADPAAGSGLAGLAERVAAVGGTLTLTSPLGGPTVLRLEMPCSGW